LQLYARKGPAKRCNGFKVNWEMCPNLKGLSGRGLGTKTQPFCGVNSELTFGL